MPKKEPTIQDVLDLLEDIERRLVRVETRLCTLFVVMGRLDEIDSMHKLDPK